NYIALIEVGKSFPSLPMLEKIAAALQIDALDLFDKDGMISIDKETLRADVLEKIALAVDEAFSAHSICP
ncbi:MAG: helix-turn-helix domain-containing protein, partial [Treponemataceae bacterium]|nr:helix-turn-helix domain-containing protein [Treponemataceae bacterium]